MAMAEQAKAKAVAEAAAAENEREVKRCFWLTGDNGIVIDGAAWRSDFPEGRCYGNGIYGKGCGTKEMSRLLCPSTDGAYVKAMLLCVFILWKFHLCGLEMAVIRGNAKSLRPSALNDSFDGLTAPQYNPQSLSPTSLPCWTVTMTF